jgi:hypothetical protein
MRYRYVYAVNKASRRSVSTRLLLWAERWGIEGVRDVFSGRSPGVETDEEGYLAVPVSLAPGDGMLLEMEISDKNAK